MKTDECRGPGDRPIISIQDGIVLFDRGDGRTPTVRTTTIVVNQPGTIQNPVVRTGKLGECRETPTGRCPPVDSGGQAILQRKTEDDRRGILVEDDG